MRPRLDAVDADVSRIFALNEPLIFDEVGLLRLEAAIIEYNPALVTIDPLFAYPGAKMDIHRANECRGVTARLAAIANERASCPQRGQVKTERRRSGFPSSEAGDDSVCGQAEAYGGRDSE